MSKQFLAVIAVVILAFVGIFIFSGNNKSNTPSKSSGSTPTNHIEGQGKSGVTLVEYGDYECPFCAQSYPIVKQVVADLNSKIYFQFRNFPLTNIHQNAFAAARAAEAAAAQGKFWEMNGLLYQNQDQWKDAGDPMALFKQYAKLLGLNVAQFQQDYTSSKVNDAINADTAAGNKLKVQGTPTFFLNGKQLSSQQTGSVSSFEQTIQAEITKKQQ